jgi:hypothetical protein
LVRWLNRQGANNIQAFRYFDQWTRAHALKTAEATHESVTAVSRMVASLIVRHVSSDTDRLASAPRRRQTQQSRSGPRPMRRAAGSARASHSNQTRLSSANANMIRPSTWIQLDDNDICLEARIRVQALKDVPGFLKGPVREAFEVSVTEI